LKDFPAIHIQPLGGDTYLNNEQPVKLLVCDVVLYKVRFRYNFSFSSLYCYYDLWLIIKIISLQYQT